MLPNVLQKTERLSILSIRFDALIPEVVSAVRARLSILSIRFSAIGLGTSILISSDTFQFYRLDSRPGRG